MLMCGNFEMAVSCLDISVAPNVCHVKSESLLHGSTFPLFFFLSRNIGQFRFSAYLYSYDTEVTAEVIFDFQQALSDHHPVRPGS